GAVHLGRTPARRRDEVDLRHEGPARMLGTEEDDTRHDVVEVGGAEVAGEADLRLRVVADRDEVDVRLAVDLPAREEEDVDPALAGAVEELAPAVGEEIVRGARQERGV